MNFYKVLEHQLQQWALDSPKLGHALYPLACERCFKIDLVLGLKIDLDNCAAHYRDKYFKNEAFYENAALLMKQVCLVMKDRAMRMGRHKFSMDVTIVCNGKKLSRKMHIYPGFS
ncbi:hypothetical protein A0256_09965 [Mucilaginibacter sp. PAMC 26640]|nr:hypothetical protein A0256_09965 [Mucilaginibacter sp. PAMC 26640]